MNRIRVMLLCLVLCLASTGDPTTTAALNIEQSTATVMTRQPQIVLNQDVASAGMLVKTTSLGSDTSASSAQETTLATTGLEGSQEKAGTPAVPPPLIRPFPAPVTTHAVTVPTTIDATGSSDVSDALMSFILSVPDGSLINFPSAGIYRIDKAVDFAGRRNLILDGNGCTLKYTSVTGTTEEYSLWRDMGGGSDIWIRNFVLIGSSPYPGIFTPGDSPTGGEWQYGVMVESDRFEVSGCTISKVWGDGLHVTGFHDVLGYHSTHTPSDIWFHDNHVISAGRNGLSVIQGKNVLAERNAFDKVGFDTFDVEPNWYFESSTNIIFRSNTAGTFGSVFFGLGGSHTASVLDGIIVDGNIVTDGSLKTLVDNGGAARMARVVFTNNTGMVAAVGPLLQFMQVDDLTVTGNVQPLASGVLASVIDCTEVMTPTVAASAVTLARTLPANGSE
jgi:hypothetical protein